MKKAFVIVLVLVFALSMTSMAFAGSMDLAHKKKCCINLKVQANLARVTQQASIKNEVTAFSGDATAVGNSSSTNITNNQSARTCKGCATNNSAITVTNYGEATAMTGNVAATNNANNAIGQTVGQSNSN